MEATWAWIPACSLLLVLVMPVRCQQRLAPQLPHPTAASTSVLQPFASAWDTEPLTGSCPPSSLCNSWRKVSSCERVVHPLQFVDGLLSSWGSVCRRSTFAHHEGERVDVGPDRPPCTFACMAPFPTTMA
eukprot:215832-Rhodomonas_salina.1